MTSPGADYHHVAMATLQRCHWSDDEKALISAYVMTGVLQQNTRPDSVPPDLLKQLVGRSAESVREYVNTIYAELTEMILASNEFIDLPMDAPPKPAPKRKRVQTPPKPKKVKIPATATGLAPPEMTPPLPRAITFGAKRMTLTYYGSCGLMTSGTNSVFDEINQKLGMHRDARTENWDGLPRFM